MSDAVRPPSTREEVRAAEVISALCLATDLGMGLPFLGAAAVVRPFLGLMRRMGPHLGRIKLATGGLLVLTGLLIATGSLSLVGQWLLETFPIFYGVG